MVFYSNRGYVSPDIPIEDGFNIMSPGKATNLSNPFDTDGTVPWMKHDTSKFITEFEDIQKQILSERRTRRYLPSPVAVDMPPETKELPGPKSKDEVKSNNEPKKYPWSK